MSEQQVDQLNFTQKARSTIKENPNPELSPHQQEVINDIKDAAETDPVGALSEIASGVDPKLAPIFPENIQIPDQLSVPTQKLIQLLKDNSQQQLLDQSLSKNNRKVTRMSSITREISLQMFSQIIQEKTSEEDIDTFLQELRTHKNMLGAEYSVVIQRITNSLEFRLAHHKVGHTVQIIETQKNPDVSMTPQEEQELHPVEQSKIEENLKKAYKTAETIEAKMVDGDVEFFEEMNIESMSHEELLDLQTILDTLHPKVLNSSTALSSLIQLETFRLKLDLAKALRTVPENDAKQHIPESFQKKQSLLDTLNNESNALQREKISLAQNTELSDVQKAHMRQEITCKQALLQNRIIWLNPIIPSSTDMFNFPIDSSQQVGGEQTEMLNLQEPAPELIQEEVNNLDQQQEQQAAVSPLGEVEIQDSSQQQKPEKQDEPEEARLEDDVQDSSEPEPIQKTPEQIAEDIHKLSKLKQQIVEMTYRLGRFSSDNVKKLLTDLNYLPVMREYNIEVAATLLDVDSQQAAFDKIKNEAIQFEEELTQKIAKIEQLSSLFFNVKLAFNKRTDIIPHEQTKKVQQIDEEIIRLKLEAPMEEITDELLDTMNTDILKIEESNTLMQHRDNANSLSRFTSITLDGDLSPFKLDGSALPGWFTENISNGVQQDVQNMLQDINRLQGLLRTKIEVFDTQPSEQKTLQGWETSIQVLTDQIAAKKEAITHRLTTLKQEFTTQHAQWEGDTKASKVLLEQQRNQLNETLFSLTQELKDKGFDVSSGLFDETIVQNATNLTDSERMQLASILTQVRSIQNTRDNILSILNLNFDTAGHAIFEFPHNPLNISAEDQDRIAQLQQNVSSIKQQLQQLSLQVQQRKVNTFGNRIKSMLPQVFRN